MPIREWWEEIRIHVECSDRELPRAIAAVQGQYRGDAIAYVSSESQTQQFLPPTSNGYSVGYPMNGSRMKEYGHG